MKIGPGKWFPNDPMVEVIGEKYKVMSLPDTKYTHFMGLALILTQVPITLRGEGGGSGGFSFMDV